MKLKKLGCVVLALVGFGVITCLAVETVADMYSAYGESGVNNAVIDFMKQHDNRWPASWAELQPHYKDLFLGTHTVVFVRHHYDIAWEIDPHKLLQEQSGEPDFHEIWDGKDSACPVIYSLRRERLPLAERHWILTTQLYQYLRETKNAKRR